MAAAARVKRRTTTKGLGEGGASASWRKPSPGSLMPPSQRAKRGAPRTALGPASPGRSALGTLTPAEADDRPVESGNAPGKRRTSAAAAAETAPPKRARQAASTAATRASKPRTQKAAGQATAALMAQQEEEEEEAAPAHWQERQRRAGPAAGKPTAKRQRLSAAAQAATQVASAMERLLRAVEKAAEAEAKAQAKAEAEAEAEAQAQSHFLFARPARTWTAGPGASSASRGHAAGTSCLAHVPVRPGHLLKESRQETFWVDLDYFSKCFFVYMCF